MIDHSAQIVVIVQVWILWLGNSPVSRVRIFEVRLEGQGLRSNERKPNDDYRIVDYESEKFFIGRD